ncbi:MAG: hypothetical protein ABIH39_02330, partial [Candidatus Margulisiibacteriota bacterium]
MSGLQPTAPILSIPKIKLPQPICFTPKDQISQLPMSTPEALIISSPCAAPSKKLDSLHPYTFGQTESFFYNIHRGIFDQVDMSRLSNYQKGLYYYIKGNYDKVVNYFQKSGVPAQYRNYFLACMGDSKGNKDQYIDTLKNTLPGVANPSLKSAYHRLIGDYYLI